MFCLRHLISYAIPCFVFFASFVQGFQLIPITMEFEPVGEAATQTFRLENNSAQTKPVQVEMVTRVQVADGSEVNESAEDEFLVYPSQVLLPPHSQQLVRVTWLGEPNPQTELAYRIIAEELQIDLAEEEQQRKGSGVEILMRYEGTVYIVPKNAEPDIRVTALTKTLSDEGEPQMEVTLENFGTRHDYLRKIQIDIAAEATPDTVLTTLHSDLLEEVAGKNLLAGASRHFVIPWPQKLNESENLIGEVSIHSIYSNE